MLCAADVNITAALSGISSVIYNQGQCSVSCTGSTPTLRLHVNVHVSKKYYNLMYI